MIPATKKLGLCDLGMGTPDFGTVRHPSENPCAAHG
jgi:hypothetical protein